MNYADFRHLTFESKPNGVLVVTINRPEVLNAANARLHWEFTQIWPVVDADPKTRVVVVTGAGKAFSAGGDLSLVEDMAGNPDALTRTMREASDLVYNMINLDKPVVSAINGVAVGAGLVVALMADVSIIAETARFTDGHTRLGVGRGRSRRDHLAAPVRDGEGEILSAHGRLHRRTRGRADRSGQRCACRPIRSCRRRSTSPTGSPRGSQISIQLDQARAQQLAAPGRADLRSVPGARDALVLVSRRARGREGDSREARPVFPSAK